MTNLEVFTSNVLKECNGYVFNFSNKKNIEYITTRLENVLVNEFGERILEKLEVDISYNMGEKYCVNIQFRDKQTGDFTNIFDECIYNDLKNI